MEAHVLLSWECVIAIDLYICCIVLIKKSFSESVTFVFLTIGVFTVWDSLKRNSLAFVPDDTSDLFRMTTDRVRLNRVFYFS